MDLPSHLDFLASHPYGVLFWSSLVEAAGIPFPSRVILILTPAFLTTDRDLVGLIVVARRRAARDGRTDGGQRGDHGGRAAAAVLVRAPAPPERPDRGFGRRPA
jgi:hypothetical protein